MPGQLVQAGEVLLALDAIPFKAEVAEARAEMDRYAEEETDARRELERAQELYNRTVTSTSEFDTARLRHSRAKSQLATAQARVERARWRLARSEARAPYPALILARMAEPGMSVAAQCQPPALISIARADEIIARARLTPAQAAGRYPGGKAEVLVAGQSHQGTVRGLTYPAAGQTAYLLDVAIPRAKGLTAGMAATIRLP